MDKKTPLNLISHLLRTTEKQKFPIYLNAYARRPKTFPISGPSLHVSYRAAIKIKNEGHYLLLGLVQQWLTAT